MESKMFKCSICFEQCSEHVLKIPRLLGKGFTIPFEISLCKECYDIASVHTLIVAKDYYTAVDYLDDYIHNIKDERFKEYVENEC